MSADDDRRGLFFAAMIATPIMAPIGTIAILGLLQASLLSLESLMALGVAPIVGILLGVIFGWPATLIFALPVHILICRMNRNRPTLIAYILPAIVVSGLIYFLFIKSVDPEVPGGLVTPLDIATVALHGTLYGAIFYYIRWRLPVQEPI